MFWPFLMISAKNHMIKNYPNPSIAVVSFISASFAVVNDLRNRSDAFLLNFYIFKISAGNFDLFSF